MNLIDCWWLNAMSATRIIFMVEGWRYLANHIHMSTLKFACQVIAKSIYQAINIQMGRLVNSQQNNSQKKTVFYISEKVSRDRKTMLIQKAIRSTHSSRTCLSVSRNWHPMHSSSGSPCIITGHCGRIGRARVSCPGDREFNSRSSQNDWLDNWHLLLSVQALSISRIWFSVTKCDIRSWCWWPGLPTGQLYKVTMSAHCHKSIPDLWQCVDGVART